MITDWLSYLPEWHLSESFSLVCISWCKMSTQTYVLWDHLTVRLWGRITQIRGPKVCVVTSTNERTIWLLPYFACRLKLVQVISVNGDKWVLASGSSLGFTAFSATCTALALIYIWVLTIRFCASIDAELEDNVEDKAGEKGVCQIEHSCAARVKDNYVFVLWVDLPKPKVRTDGAEHWICYHDYDECRSHYFENKAPLLDYVLFFILHILLVEAFQKRCQDEVDFDQTRIERKLEEQLYYVRYEQSGSHWFARFTSINSARL